MNPGNLSRRVVIQSRTITKDATGARLEAWTDSATVWAEAVTQRGNETVLVDADKNQDARQFRIRHRTLTTHENRILYQSRFYNITGITEEGIRNTLLLDAVATQSIG